jgi:hypothetical protein
MTTRMTFALPHNAFPSISFSRVNTVVISVFLSPFPPPPSPNSSFPSTSPFYHLHILVILIDFLLETPSDFRSFKLLFPICL